MRRVTVTFGRDIRLLTCVSEAKKGGKWSSPNFARIGVKSEKVREGLVAVSIEPRHGFI